MRGGLKQTILTNGGNQETIFISEPDLYRLVFKSKLPSAKKFVDWVYEEVLPTIRKQGSYFPTVERLLMHPKEYSRLVKLVKQTYSSALKIVQDQENQTQVKSKGKVYPDGTMNTTYVAETYFKMSASKFNNLLKKMGYLCKDEKLGFTLTKKYANKNFQQKRKLTFPNRNRDYFMVWTSDGVNWLLENFYEK